MAGDSLFQIQRKKLIQKYVDAKQEFRASTKPYKSSAQFTFTVTDASGGTAYLVGTAGQTLEFFNYGMGQPIDWADTTKKSTESDTNQETANQTNGTEDYVIEGLSATVKGVRVQYFSAKGPVPGSISGLNPAVRDMYLGLTPILDPAALVAPPQVQSPANLEDVLFEAIKPHLSLALEWDRTVAEKIGTLDELPEGGAKSFLRASGEPRVGNKYEIPEGYLWRRSGEPDSKLVVRATMNEAVVIPITLVNPPPSPLGTTPVAPIAVYVDVTIRLHGMSASIPSRN
jgi:hypothetical protein